MSERVPSLDGVRALSITGVILCHMGYDQGWGDPLNLGSLGVRVFFVISGFIITTLLLKELDREGSLNLPRFYFRRTLRIFPPFYFYIFAMLLISAFGWSYLTFEGALPSLAYVSNYWSNWELSGYVTSCTWSLSTEEQFYLIWPFILSRCGRTYAPIVLIAVIALSPIARTLIYHRYGPVGVLGAFHLNADHLASGCLLAFAWPRLQTFLRRQEIYPSLLAAFLLGVIFVANAQGNHPSIHSTVLPSVINLSIAFCIGWAIAHDKSFVGLFLNTKGVVWIGALSYSIYLWQQPFLHTHSIRPTLILEGNWKIIENPFVSLALILLCACLSYALIERPSRWVRDKLEPRWFPRTKASTKMDLQGAPTLS